MVALTTIFTAPASCTDVVTRSNDLFWMGGVEQRGDPDCYPPGFKDIFDSWFAPGICPDGWEGTSPEPTEEERRDGGGRLEGRKAQGGIAMCCPSGFYMKKNLPVTTTSTGYLFCASPMPATLTNVYSTTALRTDAAPADPSLETVVASTLANTYIWVDILQVRYGANDTAMQSLWSYKETADRASASSDGGSGEVTASTRPASVSATTTGGAGAGASGGGASEGDKSTTSTPFGAESKDLGTGAIAGIVVGAVVLLALLAGGLLFFNNRRRKRKHAQNEQRYQDHWYKLQQAPPDYYQQWQNQYPATHQNQQQHQHQHSHSHQHQQHPAFCCQAPHHQASHGQFAAELPGEARMGSGPRELSS